MGRVGKGKESLESLPHVDVEALVGEFVTLCQPLEAGVAPQILTDKRTGARFVECHVPADKVIMFGTIDVPLDPEDQAEYRANRDLVEDHVAFERMKEDALNHRTFSNLVAEFSKTYDPQHPLKIIGGQHRFVAIQEALALEVNEYHGVKVYFGLDMDQRLDVQLISNTNIAVATDLFDRMQETLAGPELRMFCQEVGLLAKEQDFADKRERTRPPTVRAARTFVMNFFRGLAVDQEKFDATETTPIISKTGVPDTEWEKTKVDNPNLWRHKGLLESGRAFAELIAAQRAACDPTRTGGRAKRNVDYAEKALNYAVLSAWAFVAGVLQNNGVRLGRHFQLKDQAGKDPLNAAALAKGRHKTDPENYRGLGYRTDAKERGRLTELFYLQAEDGGGITTTKIDLAIKKYHAKEAALEVERTREKGKGESN